MRVDFVVWSQLLQLDALLHEKEAGVELRLVRQFLVEGSNVSNPDAS